MRGHVEVDPIVGLRSLEAVLPLRAEYADRLDLQLCAFAQEGIIQAPGTDALLREALRVGADVVGGCPYNDTDGEAHIDRVFALARELDRDVDFHADFADEPVHRHVEVIADPGRSATAGRGGSPSAISPSWPPVTRRSRRGSRSDFARPGSA